MAEPLPADSPRRDRQCLLMSCILSESEHPPFSLGAPGPCPFPAQLPQGNLVAPSSGTCIQVGRPELSYPMLILFSFSLAQSEAQVGRLFYPRTHAVSFNGFGMFGIGLLYFLL